MKERPHDIFQVFDPVEPAPAPPACAWPGCAELGPYRAPVSPERIAEYQWFCLDHVRIYNRSWNYYVGMSDAEMEAHIRSDGTWNRPTWPLGDGPLADKAGRSGRADAKAYRLDGLSDPFGVLNGQFHGGTVAPPPELTPAEKRAFSVLGLAFPATFEEVKARYKTLVKRHHPDANHGAKDAEERLKRINEAYRTLKNSLNNGQKTDKVA